MKWVREGLDATARTVHGDPRALFASETRYTERAESAPRPELQFSQLVQILRGRRRLITTIAIIGAVLAGIIGLLITPKYTARSQVVVEPLQTGAGATPGAETAEESAIETHVITLSSRSHLQHVLDSLSRDAAAQKPVDAAKPADSAPSPVAATQRPINPVASETRSLSLDELGQRLNIWIGFLGRRGGQGPTLDLDTLERQVQVTREGRSRVISVSATSSRPESAAAIANRIAQLYVDGQIDLQRAYASRTVENVDQRVADLEQEMHRASADSSPPRATTGPAITSQGRETEARLRQLEREATAGALSDSLQRREREIRNQLSATSPDVQMLTLAAPPNRPSSTNPILFIFPALVISLIGAALLAVLLEQIDQGMRNERDIMDSLDIPYLGLIPRVRGRPNTRTYRQLLSEPFSAYGEAIRSISATLQLSAPRRAAAVVLVSSSVPKEGKTTLAVSLATYAALIGRRVLLIDLDFRNPSILKQFEGKAEIGILDLMQSDGAPVQVIKSVPELGLDYLPMLRGPADPILYAVFASERLPQLIRQLRENYDCVIMDGPSLLGIAEARLLATLADTVLFAVKWGTTRRDVARNALALLANPNDLGGERVARTVAIITQVDLKKHARFRYGDVGESMAHYDRRAASAVRFFKRKLRGTRKKDPLGRRGAP
jgi:polysaccharide biosynthesis transport protein